MTWTRFWDMNSGGGQKEEQNLIFIEAPKEEATAYFEERFGHDPNNVTCNCCGEDYSICESKTLEEASEYHRRISNSEAEYNLLKRKSFPDFDTYRYKLATIAEFKKSENVLIISKGEMKA
jgi:hypothetical protein